MNEQRYAYVARKPCRCITLLQVDDPAHPNDVAREISQAIRRGESIERTTVEEARVAEPWHWNCECVGQECLCEPVAVPS